MDRRSRLLQFLREVEDRIAGSETRLELQREVIKERAMRGQDTRGACELLGMLERALQMHMDHRDRLLKELGR